MIEIMATCPYCGSSRVVRAISNYRSIVSSYYCKECESGFQKFAKGELQDLLWRSPGYLIVAFAVIVIIVFMLINSIRTH